MTAKWYMVGGVLAVFAAALVLDWLDGPASHPDSTLLYVLLVLAGLALGWRPPWGGKGE